MAFQMLLHLSSSVSTAAEVLQLRSDSSPTDEQNTWERNPILMSSSWTAEGDREGEGGRRRERGREGGRERGRNGGRGRERKGRGEREGGREGGTEGEEERGRDGGKGREGERENGRGRVGGRDTLSLPSMSPSMPPSVLFFLRLIHTYLYMIVIYPPTGTALPHCDTDQFKIFFG